MTNWQCFQAGGWPWIVPHQGWDRLPFHSVSSTEGPGRTVFGCPWRGVCVVGGGWLCSCSFSEGAEWPQHVSLIKSLQLEPRAGGDSEGQWGPLWQRHWSPCWSAGPVCPTGQCLCTSANAVSLLPDSPESGSTTQLLWTVHSVLLLGFLAFRAGTVKVATRHVGCEDYTSSHMCQVSKTLPDA